jgi:CheY-like chemotaxis protein
MLEPKTILLVEDNEQDIELTIRAFEVNKLSGNIIVARDGVEAMEYLNSEGAYSDRDKVNPAVILLDIKMPRMDGIEVLQAVRKKESLRLLPVVMLTSSREEPDLRRCYELGVNAYVVKQVDFNDFVEAIKHIGVFWGLMNEIPSDH